MNAGLERKLVLVSAPAGFGKATLLSTWISEGEIPAGWVSLDEGDNDPVRFLTYLIAALQSIEAGIGGIPMAMLHASQPQPPPIESILTTLINETAETRRDFVLVFDDYHLVQPASIHQQLAFFLEHQPPQMHLVIATREDPPLPLSRWRARGQTVEIRQADLTSTEEKTGGLLRRVMQRKLAPTDIAALQQRTEGWVAGSQLAVLSFRGHDDVHQLVHSFTGSHRYILDYLIGEVFQRQASEVQDFLLKTSILDRFSASLCDAVRFGTAGFASGAKGVDVTEYHSSYDILLELDQANLFLVPLDQSRQWYRYHHLFAELLRQRLHTVGAPGLASLLHARASQWYEANGFPTDAAQHALNGSDWERAAALILDLDATMLTHGEVTTLLGWFRALPDEVVRADAQLCNAHSWPLILTDQVDAAEAYLVRAEQIVREQDGEDAPFLGVTAVARAHIARARGDGHRAIELSERALALLPQDKLSERSITALNLGIAQWHRGRLIEAEQALKEAQRAANGSGNDYVQYAALAFLSRAEKARGKLRRAGAWEQLAALHDMASRSGRQSVILQAYVLQALAVPTSDEGLEILSKALVLAESEGYIRTSVDLGEPMAELLRQVASRGIAPAYARRLLAALRAEATDRGSPSKLPRSSAQPLIEPLTEREPEVLPLLVEGLTRHEIAQVLSVSVNTIKAHLKGIYGKLGVHKRREAVAKARSLDLLSQLPLPTISLPQPLHSRSSPQVHPLPTRTNYPRTTHSGW